jgi:hypothetical protein
MTQTNDTNDTGIPLQPSKDAAKAAPEVDTIEASGATDDIRYILHKEDGALETHGRPEVLAEDPRRLQSDAPAPATSAGLADQVISDVDSELPDQTQSTISGGQVAKESKRGAY